MKIESTANVLSSFLFHLPFSPSSFSDSLFSLCGAFAFLASAELGFLGRENAF